MSITFLLEAVVVLGAIVLGTRASGVGVGIWGGVGTFVLVFGFGEAPGAAPGAAMAIILGVVTSAALMQAAGGIDWMVAVAARVIEKRPKQITLIAPLTAFLFTAGAGTGNIVYPLLPVVYDVAYKNGIRPSKPLTVTVVQSGIALAASPVSAAMAAMLTLTDVAPYDLGLASILAITFPACVVGIVVTSLVVNRMGKDVDDDPEIQARIADGRLAPREHRGDGTSAAAQLTYTAQGRNSAVVFLLGVLAIVLFGIFPDLRPAGVDMTTTIVLVMLVIGALIILIGRPKVASVPDQSVFKAGMTAAIALFGIAWLTATFIQAHEEYIVTTVGGWVTDFRFIFAVAVFLVAAMTTSQSTATRTIVPIGLAAGLPVGVATGMWAGALGGVYTLPANGPQIAAANFDQTGSTRLGSKLLDHSFFVPMLILCVTTVAVGSIIGAFF
ncbi:anaerobic C4-dicarboxylate transporter family protein [Demequina zhanjiangensis]|uniref:Anaerobic C4-dicarboxylate transporter family protein n=1 Tax=Demequina zhanjiangensis TaxID=3051659 RepID=A0ABT8FYT9_9MICO|nr:anaerobic C4-dicarboxylate transporter family protein [Demequina sp. SYSU T00b26]MDN4471879.1 anaerobic C4-dicarboxylate transporter family protein [Demequina sp. SYSU T00b26]